MVSGKFLALVAAFSVLGVHGVSDAPLPGYEVEDLVWEVEHTPGKPPVRLNGTIEQIHDKLLEINPDFEFYGNISPVEVQGETANASPTLTKRKDKVICDNFPRIEVEFVQDAMSYLRKVKGRPWLGPGPGKCIRVSCGFNAAIWWCNDNKDIKILPSFNNIAQGASVIIDQCYKTGQNVLKVDQPWFKMVSGQLFHDDLWNVIVRKNEC